VHTTVVPMRCNLSRFKNSLAATYAERVDTDDGRTNIMMAFFFLFLALFFEISSSSRRN